MILAAAGNEGFGATAIYIEHEKVDTNPLLCLKSLPISELLTFFTSLLVV